MIKVRPASIADETELARIDLATWTPAVSPAPAPPAGTPFFDEQTRPENVLVAETATAAVAGYAKLGQSIPLPSHQHVLELTGIAVDPTLQRAGAPAVRW
ncbi:hypothetical protein [Fodinicola feengrottensis]|uniref:hypothetical protein n=1 Tax=Fodinicola feengrottensis TaxID=435914 RepID=UPI00244185A2|nr:hypothetical protein [Fodinicola feengrottensis]